MDALKSGTPLLHTYFLVMQWARQEKALKERAEAELAEIQLEHSRDMEQSRIDAARQKADLERMFAAEDAEMEQIVRDAEDEARAAAVLRGREDAEKNAADKARRDAEFTARDRDIRLLREQSRANNVPWKAAKVREPSQADDELWKVMVDRMNAIINTAVDRVAAVCDSDGVSDPGRGGRRQGGEEEEEEVGKDKENDWGSAAVTESYLSDGGMLMTVRGVDGLDDGGLRYARRGSGGKAGVEEVNIVFLV